MPAALPAARSRRARVLDRLLNVGMLGVAGMAERGREIVGADEDAINSLDLRYGLDVIERAARLGLHDDADLFVGRLEIIGNSAIAGRARAARDPAVAARRIARRPHGALGLLGVVDERNQQGLRADIERALDHHQIVPRHAHHRRGRAVRDRLQLRQQSRNLVRRVLAVEQQPVEAAVGDDLGRDVAGQAAPESDLQPAFREGLLEGVALELHGRSARFCATAGPTGAGRRGCSDRGSDFQRRSIARQSTVTPLALIGAAHF